MKKLMTKKSMTLRPISEGAEKWLGKPIKCLDNGFVYLGDYMGNDMSIPEAARVSYGVGTSKKTSEEGLIRYLKRHAHTTPTEMVEFKFHCKMPIFVARQWIRHRTANVNEYSGRYSVMSNEFYIPEIDQLKAQSAGNKQGRGNDLSISTKKQIRDIMLRDAERSYGSYKKFLDKDLARELARIGLSVSNYTEWYWKIDLHNLMHFLGLRLDHHAQYEIRVFAEAMAKIVKDAVPIAYKAFEDYQLHSMKLSRLETKFITENSNWPMKEEIAFILISAQFKNERETKEFIEKLRQLRLIWG